MPGVSAGVVYVDIAPQVAKSFGSDLEKQIVGPADDTAKKVESSMGGMAKKVGLAIGGAFAVGKVIDFGKGAIEAAQESAKVMAQTEAVIKSTGGAANVTAKQVGDLAGAISKKTGVDDEAIQSASNLLLTFTNLKNGVGAGNKVFDEATKIAVDMGVALGTDASGSAIQLGKALNDPIAGISALSRVGVTFTDQQKDQIKTMVESGDTMGAQKVILGELSKEFGGSAAAQATASDKMKVAFGDLQEKIGTALIPVIEQLSEKLTAVITWFLDAPGPVQIMIGLAGALAAGVIGVNLATKAWMATSEAMTVVQAALNAVMALNPIVAVGIAIVALGAALVVAYTKSETFRDVVNRAFEAVVNSVLDGVGWMLDAFDKILGAFASVAEAATHIPGIGSKFDGVAEAIRGAQSTIQGWADTAHKGIDLVTSDAERAARAMAGMEKAFDAARARGETIGVTFGATHSRAVPHLAAGGIVTSPTLALVGEKEAEAIIPLSVLHEALLGVNANQGPAIGEMHIHEAKMTPAEIAAELGWYYRTRGR